MQPAALAPAPDIHNEHVWEADPPKSVPWRGPSFYFVFQGEIQRRNQRNLHRHPEGELTILK